MPDKEFDPNNTIIKKITHNRGMNWMAILGGIGTIGAALVAINAFTGLNLRPAWGFEVDKLMQQQGRVETILQKTNDQLEGAAQHLLRLNKEQLQLKIKQIELDRREARRELTELQLQREKHRTAGTSVPNFISAGISDTQERIRQLDEDKADAQTRLLQLQ